MIKQVFWLAHQILTQSRKILSQLNNLIEIESKEHVEVPEEQLEQVKIH